MENIQATRFRIEEVGKHVKASKKRFIWDLSLNARTHVLTLDFSFISGKIKISVDSKILYENELPSNVSFQYPFTLDGFSLNILQQGDSFELRINNKVFSHLYNQHKTNTEFKRYEDQVKDIKTSDFSGDSKKISINIGGLNIKKKVNKEEGATWGEASSFPNFFQNTDSQLPVQSSIKQTVTANLLEESSRQGKPVADKSTIFGFSEAISPSQEQMINVSGIMQQPEQVSASQSFLKRDHESFDFFAAEPVSTKPKQEIDFFSEATVPPEITPISATIPPVPTANTFNLFPTTAPSITTPNSSIFSMESHFNTIQAPTANGFLDPTLFGTGAASNSGSMNNFYTNINAIPSGNSNPNFAPSFNPSLAPSFNPSLASSFNPSSSPEVPQNTTTNLGFDPIGQAYQTKSNSSPFTLGSSTLGQSSLSQSSSMNFGFENLSLQQKGPVPDDFSTMQMMFSTNVAAQPFQFTPPVVPPNVTLSSLSSEIDFLGKPAQL